jgi:hypothetical protein
LFDARDHFEAALRGGLETRRNIAWSMVELKDGGVGSRELSEWYVSTKTCWKPSTSHLSDEICFEPTSAAR